MKNKKLSMAQLAKICNVSQGTVDRALHDRSGVNKKTKEYILMKAREYGYRPNKYAKDKEKHKSGLVGIIVFDLYNEFFSEMIVELEKELRKYGYCSLVMFSDKDRQMEKECIEAMYNAGADALILCPVNDGEDFMKYLKSWNIPVVTFGNKIDGVKYVGIDNFAAMKELAGITMKKHSHVIYYSPALCYKDTNIYGQKMRFEGFMAAAAEFPKERSDVARSMSELERLIRSDSVIIAATDYYALNLMFSDKTKNNRIVGFDNINSVRKLRLPIMTASADTGRITEEICRYVTGNAAEDDFFAGYEIVGRENI